MNSLSLIVTTFNRRNELIKLFKSLNQQKEILLSDLQLIFVDQGKNKKILKYLDNEIQSKYLKIDISPLSLARNIGLQYVEKEIVCFPDDDCWYDDFLISSVYKKFLLLKDHAGLCTNVMDPQKNITYGNRPTNVETFINLKNLFNLPTSIGLFIKSAVMKELNLRFNENYGAGKRWGSAEEMEFLYQILKHELKVVYLGNIFVYHPVSSTYNSSDIKKYYYYGLGFGALNAKMRKDGIREHLKFFRYVIFRGILGFLGNLFVFKFNYSKLYFNRTKGILLGYFENRKYGI